MTLSYLQAFMDLVGAARIEIGVPAAGAIVSLLAALTGVGGYYQSKRSKRIADALAERAATREELESSTAAWQQMAEGLREDVAHLKKEVTQCEADKEVMRREMQEMHQQVFQLQQELRTLKG